MKALQARIYFDNLPDDKKDDALTYLNGMFKRHGQKTAEVLNLVKNLKRKAS